MSTGNPQANETKVDFYTRQLRYHRAMAVACADDPVKSDLHAAEMRKALDELRKIALANAEGDADPYAEFRIDAADAEVSQ